MMMMDTYSTETYIMSIRNQQKEWWIIALFTKTILLASQDDHVSGTHINAAVPWTTWHRPIWLHSLPWHLYHNHATILQRKMCKIKEATNLTRNALKYRLLQRLQTWEVSQLTLIQITCHTLKGMQLRCMTKLYGWSNLNLITVQLLATNHETGSPIVVTENSTQHVFG